ncbi:hypothetical protein ACFVVX_09390 [Kitasatospora sp. NPDC058170]|uniref:hypothetical protein n=1 Tax=Kitasatospora sp. NPDC058170 TaxID=3346364 RepID=UPI0036D9922F
MPVPIDVPEPEGDTRPPSAPPAGEADRGAAAGEPAATATPATTATPTLSPSELTSLQRKLQAKYH